MKRALIIPSVGNWQTKIESCGHSSKITHRVRLATGIAMKIHTMTNTDHWAIEFPWGGRTRVAKRRAPEQGLSEAKRCALTRVVANWELALRTSKKLLDELDNE